MFYACLLQTVYCYHVLINGSIDWSVKENVHYNFPEPKLTYSYCLFCFTNSPKPKYIQFSIIKEEKANIYFWAARTWEFGVFGFKKNTLNPLIEYQNCCRCISLLLLNSRYKYMQFVVHLPEQTCVSAPPQQQTARPHSRQSDSACNGPPPHLKGPIWTCLVPRGKL